VILDVGILPQITLFGPVVAMLVAGSTIIATVAFVEGHVVILVTSYLKTFVPIPKATKLAEFTVWLAIFPVGVSKLQAPLPNTGTVAVIKAVGVRIHNVWLALIKAGLVIGSTMMVANALFPGQTPTLVMLYCTTFVPTPSEVKFVSNALGLVTAPVGVISVHNPVPVVAVAALTVVDGTIPQIVCIVGVITALLVTGSTTIVAVILLLGQVLPATFTATN
jgi:hypothetical protein